jgi:hypothetical protein
LKPVEPAGSSHEPSLPSLKARSGESFGTRKERAGDLLASRDRLAEALEVLRKSPPPPDDGTKKSKRAIKDWDFDIASLEKLIGQIESTFTRTAQERPVAEPADRAAEWVQHGVTIASIPKGRRAELRVSVNEWQGLRTIDVRLWYIPKSGGVWGPSRKGVSFDAGKIDALLEALLLAKQHVAAPS